MDRRPGRSRRSPALVLGATLAAFFMAVAATALFWTPHPVAEQDIAHRLAGPSPGHWLGTDHLGRDVLSRLMAGAGNSIAVALASILLGAALGVPLGALGAARGGWTDEAVMRLSDLVFAFPALLSAIMITAVFGPGVTNSILAIGIFNIPIFARQTRGAALVVWQLDYVLAARALGKGPVRITLEHVLPNVASVLIVQMTLQFAVGVVAEAGLSYLGLGTQPPAPSWGTMLNEARTLLFLSPRMAVLPGSAIVLLVLAFHLLGDALRDSLDPRLRRLG